MINVSNDYKIRMQENRNFKSYAEVTFPNGTEITLEDSQFSQSNNSLVDGTGVSSFPLGLAVQKNVQLEFINDKQQYANYDFVGSKIRLYTDFQLDELNPWIGRNYLRNPYNGANATAQQVNWSYDQLTGTYELEVTKNNGTSTQQVYFTNIVTKIDDIKDKTVTFSVEDFYSSDSSLKPVIQFRYTSGANNTTVAGGVSPDLYLKSGANKITFTAKTPEDVKGAFFILRADQNKNAPVGTKMTLKGVKLEIGDASTEYQIAPEDIRTERIEKGTYTVISPETYGETIIVTAYDDMYKADKEYTTSLLFPQSAGSVLRDACSTCGINLGSTKFLHDDFMIQEQPTGTFRDVIGNIAMIACGNARIDTRNRLQIMSYDFSGWDYDISAVAGENIVLGSGVEYTNSNYLTHSYTLSEDFELDEWYTVTIWGELADEKTAFQAYIGNGSGPITSQTASTMLTEIEKGVYQIIGRKRSWSNDAQYQNRNKLLIYAVPNTVTGVTSTIKKIKVEHGSVEKPIWTPAQGDAANPYFLLDEFKSPKIEYNDTVITGFKTVIKGETSEDDEELLQGTDTYVISVENPLIKGKEQTVLSWLLERIGNVSFRPFSGDSVSNPLIEFMDLAKVKDRRGNEYNTFITDVNFLMPGYTTLKNSTPSMARSMLEYTSDSARVEQRTRELVEKEKNNRELAVEELQQSMAQGSGLYPTTERQPDGSNIYYLHNKPTRAESKIVIKLTTEGIGISLDGGNTYPWGITFTGRAILDLIYAVGINCDYLETGAITIKDGDGNIIFSADIDSKKVQIGGMRVEKNLLINEYFYDLPEFTEEDADKALRAASGLIELTDEETKLYDRNQDGKITAADARMILQMVEGKRVSGGTVVTSIGTGSDYAQNNFLVQSYKKNGELRTWSSMSAWGIECRGQSIEDFVVKQGTHDIWTYRIWESGIMELWGTKSISTSIAQAWGSLYISGGIAESRVDFPFPFASVPTITANLTCTGNSAFLIAPGSSYTPTVNSTGAFEIARSAPVNEVKTYDINYHVIGNIEK